MKQTNQQYKCNQGSSKIPQPNSITDANFLLACALAVVVVKQNQANPCGSQDRQKKNETESGYLLELQSCPRIFLEESEMSERTVVEFFKRRCLISSLFRFVTWAPRRWLLLVVDRCFVCTIFFRFHKAVLFFFFTLMII